ncbi:glycosyltransferase [Cognatitamlana onchidii]|uniref:glycosyltransferase n=1 Tax=Cognatitamlana onchidii TaxID=2562860 RepID=UPI0010A6701B|nr:glycosyltransferase [Algibacter onchidii]
MPKKIKILYTIPNFDTAGSGKVVYDLVKGLDKTVFSPEICVFHTKGAFFKKIEALNVPIHVFQFTADYKPLVSFAFKVLKICRFFKKHRFDIIHSWHWSSDFSEPLAAKLVGIPFVYTKKAMGWGNKAWLWRSKLSSKIIAINNDMLSDFFKSMPNKVIQLPLGVDTIEYSPQSKNFRLASNLGISDNDFVIATVVNMVPVKGIEVLLDAVKIINNKKIKVLIIGNDKSDYADALKIKYHNDEFLFLGKKMDVKPYLALSNVFVIPTKNEGRKEGMPIAPLEAMAMGIPVIGSNISGIKDILHKYPQFLFEPSNSNDLAEKINFFINNHEFDKLELIHWVRQNFSLDSFIEQRESFYKLMLRR